MEHIRVVFFGSTTDSVRVLSRLHQLVIGNWSLDIVSVVTQPPRPVDRKQVLTQTPVETWAITHKITVLSFPTDPDRPWLFADEGTVIEVLQPLKADLLVSACYGQKIPWETIRHTRFGGLNVHPSLLPRWRGADPVPWAILTGDYQTGVTVVTLSEKFDEGAVIAQKKIPIAEVDTSDALRTKLFMIGADLLIQVIANLLSPKRSRKYYPIPHKPIRITPYARRFTRQDGFEPWGRLQKAFGDRAEATRIERKVRALSPWPGVWTTIKLKTQRSKLKALEKRLKILTCHISRDTGYLSLDIVQLEGKKPVLWPQLRSAYPLFPT